MGVVEKVKSIMRKARVDIFFANFLTSGARDFKNFLFDG